MLIRCLSYLFPIISTFNVSASFATESEQLDTVNLQLRWHHQFQFAGYYAALEKGFYRDEGLDVKIRSGDPAHQPTKEVLSGRAQYAEGNSEILYQRLLGKPLVALAPIFQHSPSVLITLQSSGIRTVHDLVGKKVMLTSKSEDADFLTMFLNEGISFSQLDIVASSYELDDLISGKVAAFNSYTTNEPYLLEQNNIAYNIIDPISYSVDFYSDIFFTSEHEVKNNPERVEAMLRATLKGWRYALDNPEEIIELLKTKYHVNKTRDHLRFEAQQIRKLIIPDLIQIGHTNPERWQHMADTFIKTGLVVDDKYLDGFIYEKASSHLPVWVLPALFMASILVIVTSSITFYLHRFNKRIGVAQKTLSESEERFKALSAATYGGILIHDNGQILECNSGLTDITGFNYFELISMNDLRFIAPEYLEIILHKIPTQNEDSYEIEGIRKDGSRFPIAVKGKHITYKGIDAQVLEIRDITERKKTEEQLELAASVFTHAREGIIITDPLGLIIDVNDTFSRITGYSREEALGQNPSFLSSNLQDKAFYSQMWASLVTDKQWSGEIWNKRKDGELFAELVTISAVLDVRGKIKNYVALFSDITPMKKHQKQLEHIALYDTLTNLPNRILLAERLNLAMEEAEVTGLSTAVAYLDLDGFKIINDTYGHNVGDDLLIQLSTSMNGCLREGDTLARIGGDEFVAVLTGIENMKQCQAVLNRLLKAAMSSVNIGNQTLQVSTSIGITLYPQDGVDADQLLRHADHAMYIAKQSGKNKYHLFDVHKDKSIKTQRQMIEYIENGLECSEFELFYQPKVNMRTGEVVGVEALIRWHHPELGLLLPDDFLPFIDCHQLSITIGEWVLDSALSQIEAWQAQGYDIPISANIDAFQIQQTDFVDNLSALLAKYPKVKPHSLQIEILETSALGDLADVMSTMKQCMDIGVNFALDDFGTGFSSLTYLKRLPADVLKIDQSFVRDMLIDPDDRAIVKGVINLAAAFNREVTAEGVESIDHGTQLLSMGCDLAQGYGIARPMPAGQFIGWLQSWRPDKAWLPKI
ncbi:EAL domain-containing protein [Vibrio sp. TH_r3]|uniref:EAL domain-containing protein n=1 Tax=Vibrio sp. TH_r3 TaxID=3082084 RepID=UPI002953BE21|nr:EAL domain-containing protein [Vibrio sp. TH_r3]MDV7103742.1 EAL domain-containing protein [Vibrio sp. TH_r3]